MVEHFPYRVVSHRDLSRARLCREARIGAMLEPARGGWRLLVARITLIGVNPSSHQLDRFNEEGWLAAIDQYLRQSFKAATEENVPDLRRAE